MVPVATQPSPPTAVQGHSAASRVCGQLLEKSTVHLNTQFLWDVLSSSGPEERRELGPGTVRKVWALSQA